MQNGSEESKKGFGFELSPEQGDEGGENMISPEVEDVEVEEEPRVGEKEQIRKKVKMRVDEMPLTPERAEDIIKSARSLMETGDEEAT